MTLHVHYWPTPNGQKVAVFLEEAGLEYKIVSCDIRQGAQFEPRFLELNPNNRMPVLVDDEPAGGGPPVSVFESGAILLYLAEKSGRFWPQDPPAKYEVVQWVMWQMANQGPKFGEYLHFKHTASKHGDQSYGVRRFSNEVNRLYGVLNNRLVDRRHLAGEAYTIADMMSYPWAGLWQVLDQDIEEFPHFKRWFDEVGARPGVQRGMAVGKDLSTDISSLPAAEKARLEKLIYNQRARPVPQEKSANSRIAP